jgi:glutamate-1-semialdehyde aminotransferase
MFEFEFSVHTAGLRRREIAIFQLLAEEHEGIEADLTLVGKALSGGFYPVSAVLSTTKSSAC